MIAAANGRPFKSRACISARVAQRGDRTFRPNVNVLFSLLLDKAQAWRRDGFPHERLPTAGEILSRAAA